MGWLDRRSRAGARPPRRRTRRRGRLAAAPLQRRDPRRSGLGPRRRGHEGLQRDAALHRASTCPRRHPPGPAAGAVLHRRRGGRRAQGSGPARGAPPRVVRGLHLRRGRGRRVLHHRAWSPALPDRGGREGDGVDAPDRHRQRRPRVDAASRQRSHHARGGGGPDRPAPVAGAAHAHDEGAARGGGGAGRDRGDTGERRGARRGVRQRRQDARCGDPAHHEPDDAAGGLQGERGAGTRDCPGRRTVPPRLRGRLPRHAPRAGRARGRHRVHQQAGRPGDDVRRGDGRCDDRPPCSRRTPRRSSRRT